MAKAYSKLDSKNQIFIPRVICRELMIRPGDKLELITTGTKKAMKLVMVKLQIPVYRRTGTQFKLGGG